MMGSDHGQWISEEPSVVVEQLARPAPPRSSVQPDGRVPRCGRATIAAAGIAKRFRCRQACSMPACTASSAGLPDRHTSPARRTMRSSCVPKNYPNCMSKSGVSSSASSVRKAGMGSIVDRMSPVQNPSDCETGHLTLAVHCSADDVDPQTHQRASSGPASGFVEFRPIAVRAMPPNVVARFKRQLPF